MSYNAVRGNRELTIPEEKAEEYSQMGYAVLDSSGKKVINAAVVSVAEADEKIKSLELEVEVLRAENRDLRVKLEEVGAPKAETVNPETENGTPETAKPKVTKRKVR